MTWRLVVAQVWRIRLFLAMLMFLGANGAVQSTGIGARFMMAMPLLMAFNALFMLGLFWSRDVQVLPIQRRVALRSAWLAALALPLAIMAGRLLVAAVQFALGFALTRDLEAIVLAMPLEAVYVGVSLTILQADDTPWTSLRQVFGNLRVAGGTLLVVLLLAVPFARPELVPQSLGEVTWLHIAGILAGVAVAVWPLMTAPDQWPRLGALHDAPRDSVAEPRRLERPIRRIDRLVGLPRLLANPVTIAALMAVLVVTMSVVIGVVRGALHSPFAADTTDMGFFLIGGPFFLLIFGPFSLAPGLTPFLRRLKTLPVSTMRLAVTMTTLPLMMPVFFWILSCGIHVAIGAGGDVHWRLGSVALLCGVMALISALHARFNSFLIVMVGSLVPTLCVFALMLVFDKVAVEPVIAFWFPVIGLIGVPLAFFFNYRTVSRGDSSSAAYRPAPGESLYRGGA